MIGQFKLTTELNQLGIHLACAFDIHVHDAHRNRRLFLHPIQHLQPASAPVAAQGVRRVSHILQLIQHKARHPYRRADESCCDDIRDATINDHTGVEQHDIVVLRRVGIVAEVYAPGSVPGALRKRLKISCWRNNMTVMPR